MTIIYIGEARSSGKDPSEGESALYFKQRHALRDHEIVGAGQLSDLLPEDKALIKSTRGRRLFVFAHSDEGPNPTTIGEKTPKELAKQGKITSDFKLN